MVVLFLLLLITPAAHNAYDEGHPTTPDTVFTEALDLGFANIELDVVLTDARLEVRHDCDSHMPTRPLERYLDDFAARIAEHDGSVHGDGREFVLTIDVKDCDDVAQRRIAARLDDLFRSYRPLLNPVGGTGHAITICLTGDDDAKGAYQRRVRDRRGELLARADRVIGGDHPILDDPRSYITEDASAYRCFLAIHWRHVEPGFDGDEGPWTTDDAARLAALLAAATERGYRVRFYALNGAADSYRFAGGPDAARERWLALDALADSLHFVATDDRDAIAALDSR